jgi:hypothetical protein
MEESGANNGETVKRGWKYRECITPGDRSKVLSFYLSYFLLLGLFLIYIFFFFEMGSCKTICLGWL